MRTAQLCREFDLQLRYTTFPLHPDTPEEGLTLEQMFGGRVDVDAMLKRLSGIAKELGLPFGERTHSYNSRRAQELGKWAERQGSATAYQDAVYRAYFADGLNIDGAEVLANIITEIGLDAETARQIMEQKTFAAEVDADWQRCRELGITSVPTLLYGTRALVGFNPYAEFRKLIVG